ncbi:MAG: TonB-dependent receptor [Bacteroidetes bacterium HGW-Bacteroidetes-21]|nr:MAG: TonB-dependent receptor [Bacteroidetes bacterium HGW-Bacteroidetes-21]
MKKFFLFLFVSVFYLNAQSQCIISGKITDPGGNPVVSANVLLENTFQGTFSNKDGNYIIKNVKKGTYSIRISFIGYQTFVKEISVVNNLVSDFTIQPAVILSDEVTIQASSVSAKTPIAFSSVNAEQIKNNNLGQDMTYMISMTPSVVVSSDAGTGVGYTGISIRGTDVKRTNVTVNGIPLNDAESHGVFWVNMPDFASSVQNIQIQRGVGTSTNGAGVFGATINMQTNALHALPYAEVMSSAGSFNTFKNTVSVGTGLINNRFTFDARMSKINSDGFVDRAFSDLKSIYLSGGYYSEGSALKLIIFSGKEITYQAWNGVPKVRLENDTAGMRRYADHWLYTQEEYQQMLESNNRTYNYYTYKNEVDNYQQDHYQLHYSKEFTKNLYLNSAIHYTYGRGYFEGYKTDKEFEKFGLAPYILGNDTVFSSDFVTQKWLDNDFYGGNISLRFVKSKLDIVGGGSITKYEGRHYGDIIWAKLVTFTSDESRWYQATGDKMDASFFLKVNYQLNGVVNIYGDLQYRDIEYTITGKDDDLREISQQHHFGFFNPKAGVTYTPTENQRAFLSVAIAHREPSRSDYTDADQDKTPKPEKLTDYEAGYDISFNSWRAGVNLFNMIYKDQLIMTGQINNVGAPVMANVENNRPSKTLHRPVYTCTTMHMFHIHNLIYCLLSS